MAIGAMKNLLAITFLNISMRKASQANCVKHLTLAHSINIFIVLLLIWIISIGCKNGSNNANIKSNISSNEISGDVFPANEVCYYADLPITQKYYKVERRWGENDSVDLGADFRYLCIPYPAKSMTLFDDVVHKMKVSYDARGNRIEGAHTIYMEYKASTADYISRLETLDQKVKKEALIPLFSEVVKKALKQSPSAKALEKIQNGKTAARDRSSCEKVGNGFICIDNFESLPYSIFVEMYIFVNEAAMKNHFEEQNGSTN